MICSKCKGNFLEKDIEESHNVPLYLFQGNTKNERKNQADKYGRKNLCKKCHDNYEAHILRILYLNLLRKQIGLIVDREERQHYFPQIWRLPKNKKEIGIKICFKLNEDEEDDTKTVTAS